MRLKTPIGARTVDKMSFKMPGRWVLLVSGALGISAVAGSASGQTAPAELWPTQVPAAADAGTLDVRVGKLESAVAAFPDALRPAVQFEETFLRIMSGAPENEWLPPVRTFSAATASDPVSVGVRGEARAWLARTEMEAIGPTLDQYYGENVRYPATFAEVEKLLPTGLKTDPWGETWVYRPHAPKGFGGETRQRYQIGPKRYPGLGGMRDAIGGRQTFLPPAWKVTLQAATNNRALEFQLNGVGKGLISAGGKIDDYRLLYVGERWALMASTDQLFTIAF